MEFCSVSKDQADLDRDNATNMSNADNDIEKFSNIAKRITYISVLWEVGLGLVSIIGFMIKLASVPALSCRSGVANKIYCKALSYIIRSHTQHASQWTFSIA